ncbi:nuclear transport factor 2 family protein [Streptomyces cinnabarinus]|uniref:Nuclear transport factor 2 family protein n=1 Tax=Streptomyces cinnabarinus TaxID=67287 RepID=A0ABY7KQ26_9ACTN|nr:nuclear transport factor 2 family protein [Streptomyces cinnabarinus]WAZ26672.1 nuclear transport factor 2 family protein [Streptomyces cinnabarinus]
MNITHHKALETAQAFIAAFEDRDRDAVAALLAPIASFTIPLSIEGTPEPWYVFDSPEQVLGYIASVAAKFDHVAFLDKVWTVSEDARSVFLQANGDILSSAEKLVYNNVYIFRIDVQDGQITTVWEYANPVAYANLGIANSEAEAAAQAR